MHLAMGASLPLPKYHQVYLVLREQLAEGRHDAGLPGELALAGQFGVARVTVRKALQRLADEGLISRAPGRGTAPVKRAAAPATTRRAPMDGLLQNLIGMAEATTVEVLCCDELPAPEPVAAALGLEAGAPVQKAVRVRSTREGPLSHITTWVPAALARFGRRELARQPILLLLEAQGLRIGRAEQRITAKLADAEVARHLKVEVGSPLLAVQRLVFDADDRPVQWLQGLYRPDRYEYRMQLSRVGGMDAKVWVSKELTAQFH
jgi:GntR family transcriptional regulator